ncbi:MAG: hypothetical protein A3H98_13500, partial [Bacteroidetes bacterium RIFCSPLOWO2_02_FULL_36_8]
SWFNLLDSRKDLEFVNNANAYLSFLQKKGYIENFRITRRKFGFGPAEIGEFSIEIGIKNLAQLDESFLFVATREPEIEKLHAGIYTMVKDVKFALYRDFPDEVRQH